MQHIPLALQTLSLVLAALTASNKLLQELKSILSSIQQMSHQLSIRLDRLDARVCALETIIGENHHGSLH